MKRKDFIMTLTLIIIFTLSAYDVAAQNLSHKITRLHILANSDSTQDQALKLQVRDEILQRTDILEGGYSKENITSDTLLQVEKIAQEKIKKCGFDYSAKASLVNMYFDTRVYEGFALPAGKYDALRVEIGKAEGKNWWCVLFPPLCNGLAIEEIDDVAELSGLSEDDIGLITKEGEVYALRFKTAEIIGKIKHMMFDRE